MRQKGAVQSVMSTIECAPPPPRRHAREEREEKGPRQVLQSRQKTRTSAASGGGSEGGRDARIARAGGRLGRAGTDRALPLRLHAGAEVADLLAVVVEELRDEAAVVLRAAMRFQSARSRLLGRDGSENGNALARGAAGTSSPPSRTSCACTGCP